MRNSPEFINSKLIQLASSEEGVLYSEREDVAEHRDRSGAEEKERRGGGKGGGQEEECPLLADGGSCGGFIQGEGNEAVTYTHECSAFLKAVDMGGRRLGPGKKGNK